MATGYITVPRKFSEEIANKIVEERLAACVNIVECKSIYKWDGNMQTENESIIIVKTSEDAFQEMVLRVKELSPYEISCIEKFDESWIDMEFKEWRDEFVRMRKR
jgi:periplasmic divalent cation tolerance protein